MEIHRWPVGCCGVYRIRECTMALSVPFHGCILQWTVARAQIIPRFDTASRRLVPRQAAWKLHATTPSGTRRLPSLSHRNSHGLMKTNPYSTILPVFSFLCTFFHDTILLWSCFRSIGCRFSLCASLLVDRSVHYEDYYQWIRIKDWICRIVRARYWREFFYIGNISCIFMKMRLTIFSIRSALSSK